MIGHGEMMLSSIAERLNCYGQIVSDACATARDHAESLDPCGFKTRQDMADIGRARRVHAKHIGAKAPSRRPLPGGRSSKWKIRMDGTAVPREGA